MAFPLLAIPAGISALTGLADLFGGKSKKKKQEAQQQQILNNAPKLDYQKNPLTGLTTSPMQGMLGYSMLDMLFKQMAPKAGLSFGDEFSNMYEQYLNPQMAFWGFGAGQQNNPMNWGQAGPMGQSPTPQMGGQQAPQLAALDMLGSAPGNPMQRGGGGFDRDMFGGGGMRGGR